MRKFVSPDFTCESWKSVESYLLDLQNRDISTKESFKQWLFDKSELEAVLEENMAWRYIKMTINTLDEKLTESYQFFVTEIQPNLAPFEDSLNQKMMASSFVKELATDKAYSIYFRGVQSALELFREENISLETELSTLSQQFGAISGKQMISYEGKELTMPQAANFLKDPNETVRKEVYELITSRRLEDREALDDLFNQLIQLRNKVAKNADCVDYRDYKFKALGRFDYTVEDCLAFHDAIETLIVPIVKQISLKKLDKLGKSKLKPWDTEVDPDGLAPLKPFENGEELLDKSIAVFQKLDSYFGDCLKTMKTGGFLDLDSKAGKAPGGYNYPLYESGIPFIFMNAAGAQRDLTTMVHEGGHAVHSFLSRDLELTGFKSLPSEVAELASMSMELLTMELWGEFYTNENDLKRAKLEQIESVVKVLPWIAQIDAFQHWIYTHPTHTTEERTQEWLKLSKRFGTGLVDYNGYEAVLESSWQKQLHLFEVPFYYIEYGIAQLGALGVWNNYKKNPAKALTDYKNALSLGYSKSIPEIYETAGLKFDFSQVALEDLSKGLVNSINELN
ncbi:M3 family oligoendopeptidase [Fluviicola taffensis]|uniref:Oligoendopeptidase, M3 family n=1 Tax=Fluviicola taffensis (strain DSM 16823 / NCIMB 13979 / RW262) TaxID=755732 RepID=F2ID71_FLUTR|nr:M3 family oligoendopeptidase [Fluviicola taffensis]AEA45486.1 oligoendopeptidase, M3 family [Fluviicola taffensis DSM 16823]